MPQATAIGTASLKKAVNTPEYGALATNQLAEPVRTAVRQGYEIRILDDLGAAEGIWRGFEKDANLTPFQSFDWLKLWLDVYCSPCATEPRIVILEQNGSLRLIAPLAVRRSALGKGLIWLGDRQNDYNAPICDPEWLGSLSDEDAHAIWQGIINSVANVDFVFLRKQPEQIGDQPNPFAAVAAKPFSAKAYYLDLDRDWKSIYAGMRSKKSRKRLAGKAARLAESGRMIFRCVREADDIREKVGQIIGWKESQLDARGAPNPFNDGRTEKMFVELGKLSGDANPLRVYVLEIDGHAIAGCIMLIKAGVMNLFVTAYENGEHKNNSPGTVIHLKLMELATRSGFKQFDFSVGDEPYKVEFQGKALALTYCAQSRTLRGVPAAILNHARISLKSWLKSKENLLNLVFTINARLGGKLQPGG